MARRRKGEIIEWKLTIPAWLAWEIECLCFNPMRGKADYGARSQLITELLIAHLEKVRPSATATQPSPSENPPT